MAPHKVHIVAPLRKKLHVRRRHLGISPGHVLELCRLQTNMQSIIEAVIKLELIDDDTDDLEELLELALVYYASTIVPSPGLNQRLNKIFPRRRTIESFADDRIKIDF